ncbi:MAG TPA: threonine synthase [Bacteroidota bacterium]|nr:threonine synthase [Bacteroidota bacterium]
MSINYFKQLKCSRCGNIHEANIPQTICRTCGRVLIAEYDLQTAKKEFKKEMLQDSRNYSLWRYEPLLPIRSSDSIISLAEGWTPILKLSRVNSDLGISNLFLKEEACNPTGSFKARGLCLAVSKAHELGIQEVAMPSAGNAGGALAAYAAKAKIRAHVFVPKETPAVNIAEVSLYGAEVTLVDGNISDAAKKMNELNADKKWFDMSTLKEPYRLEGKKTMGYEIAEQFRWNLPDVILYPTGGGTGLIGMWKAFNEMEQLGWIGSKRPKMVSVQTSGCAPVVKAFEAHATSAEFWNDAQTLASGLRVPKPFADDLILQALYESSGTAVAVDDNQILKDIKKIAFEEGMLLSPEGAATVSAARLLRTSGFIKENDSVLLFNTGSGYKYIEVMKLLDRHNPMS